MTGNLGTMLNNFGFKRDELKKMKVNDLSTSM